LQLGGFLLLLRGRWLSSLLQGGLRDALHLCVNGEALREGVNSKEAFAANTASANTFRQQSEWWLDYLAVRTRKPVKPATICGWRQALHAWILPNIGEKQVAEVSNGVLRELVAKMVAAGLSPKTIVNYSQVVKLVLASAVNEEGDQIYPRKWNHDFIGIPLVQKEKQHRPTVTETELGEILSSVSERYRVLFALLAGTGLRIGEALGLKGSDLSPDCRLIRVQRSVWGGQEQSPKTANAVRVVDVPEPLARVLQAHTKPGYLFSTAKGRPLQNRNVLRVLHATGKRLGFHAFRRFRLTWLRKQGVPSDLERCWMGHASREIGDIYSKLKDDVQYRREWCERVGLGFSVGLFGLQNKATLRIVKVA
jgi:integrase